MEEIFEIFTISDDVYEIWRILPQLIALTMIILIIAKNLLTIVSLYIDVVFVVWLVCCLHKTPAETYPKFPSVLRVIDRSDRNSPITATSATF